MALTADIGTPAGTIRPVETPGSRTNVFEGLNQVASLFSDLKGEQARAQARAAAEMERQRDNLRQDRADQRAEVAHSMSVADWEQKNRDREAENAAARLAFDHRARTLENMSRPDQPIMGEGARLDLSGGQVATPGMFDPNTGVNLLGKEGQAAVAKVEKYQTALVQGRVSQSMVDLQTRNLIDGFLAKNPDQAAVFAKALKDRGIEDPFIRSIEAEQDAQTAVKNIERQTQEAYVKAASNVGLAVFNEDGTIDLANTMKVGERVLREQDAVNRAKAALDAKVAQGTLSKQEYDRAKEEFGTVAMSSSYKVVDEATNSVIMSLGNLFRAAGINNDPKQMEQLLTVSVPAARQALQSMRSNIIQQLGDNVPDDVYKNVTDLIDKRIKDVEDLVSGDASVIQTRMAALKNMETQLGLRKNETFPAWTYFSSIFGPGNLMEMISGGNLASMLPPDQLSALRQELATGISNPRSKEASLTLSNTALVLSGKVKLDELDPTKQRNSLPGLMNVSAKDARTIATVGGGPPTWDRFVNAQAATNNAVVASALPSTMTHNSFRNAVSGLVGGLGDTGKPMVAAAIVSLSQRPGYEDEARALANSTTIAGMKLLNGSEKLIQEASKGGIYNIRYNEREGRYSIVIDQAKLNAAMRRPLGMVGGTQVMSNTAPSQKEAQELTNSLNQLIGNMASLRDLDPTFQGSKVDFNEAKTFFATGKTPKSLKGGVGQEQTSARQQFEKAAAEFDKAINQSIDLTQQQRDEAVKASGRRAPAQVRSIIEQASIKNGVDPDLMEALAYQESRFNSSAVSPKGAKGLAQLMPGTAKELGVDINDPNQNVEGGARYLAQQIKRFGSLELGLAAYNAGPGTVEMYKGIPPFPETQNYVKNVMAQYEAIRGK